MKKKKSQNCRCGWCKIHGTDKKLSFVWLQLLISVLFESFTLQRQFRAIRIFRSLFSHSRCNIRYLRDFYHGYFSYNCIVSTATSRSLLILIKLDIKSTYTNMLCSAHSSFSTQSLWIWPDFMFIHGLWCIKSDLLRWCFFLCECNNSNNDTEYFFGTCFGPICSRFQMCQMMPGTARKRDIVFFLIV